MSTGFTILQLFIKPQVAEFVLLVEGGHETQPNRRGLLPSWLELDHGFHVYRRPKESMKGVYATLGDIHGSRLCGTRLVMASMHRVLSHVKPWNDVEIWINVQRNSVIEANYRLVRVRGIRDAS